MCVCLCVCGVRGSFKQSDGHTFSNEGGETETKKTCSSTLDVRDDIRNPFRQSPTPLFHIIFSKIVDWRKKEKRREREILWGFPLVFTPVETRNGGGDERRNLSTFWCGEYFRCWESAKVKKEKKKEKENLILADELWVFFVCPFARFLIFGMG